MFRVLRPDDLVGDVVEVVPSEAVRGAEEHREEFEGIVLARVRDGLHPIQWAVLDPYDDNNSVYFALADEIHVIE